MTKARRGLIKEFYNAAESGKFDKNKCPLCGTNFSDINSAIIETEQLIKNIHTDGIKIIEDIGKNNMHINDFDYELPQELIAQTPAQKRDCSRLMVVDRKTGEVAHKHFYDIIKK